MQNVQRTQTILSDLFEGNNLHTKKTREDASKIVSKMLEHNPNLDPDTLARATFYFVCSQSKRVSVDQVRRMRKNGDEENPSWPNLLPIIRVVLGE